MGHKVAESVQQPWSERRQEVRPVRVLVADDDRDTVNTLATILETEGHVVQCVYNGSEVLSTVRFFRPDAVIVDISLPGISGYAVAQALRYSFTDLRRPLMIAISGIWKELPDRLVAEQVGFDHHLQKPCDPLEIVELLADYKKRPGAGS